MASMMAFSEGLQEPLLEQPGQQAEFRSLLTVVPGEAGSFGFQTRVSAAWASSETAECRQIAEGSNAAGETVV